MSEIFAIKPNGVGNEVSARAIKKGWSLEGEEAFTVDFDPTGYVLAENGTSLRRRSSEERIAEDKRAKLDEITAARERALRGLVVQVNGASYDANEESHARIERAIAAWQRAVQAGDPRAPQNVQWLDANNVPRRLTLQQLMEVSAAIWLEQEASVWARNTVLKPRIEKANSVAAIKAVRWDDGE